MADSATDLQTLLESVLAAATAALDTIPGFAPGLEGSPVRTFISDGQPTLNCCPGQLTVNGNPIREAPTEPLGMGSGTRHRLGMRLNLVGIQVWIARCRPTASPQIPWQMTEHSAQTNADAWALWNYMWNINRKGSSDPIVSLCSEWYMDNMTPLQPSGTCSGWVLNVRAELAGYGDGVDP